MNFIIKAVSNILSKASNPRLDTDTAQWIVTQEECSHIWRAQRIANELNEIGPDYISNKVMSAMNNLILILNDRAGKYGLPMPYKRAPQLVEKGDLELFERRPRSGLKGDALKSVDIQYVENVSDQNFLANILTFCFHMIKGCEKEISLLENVKNLGSAVIPYMFVIDPQVSMPATKCLTQICGIARYLPPLAIVEVLIAKATLIWFGNGSSQTANKIGIKEYLAGEGRHLADKMALETTTIAQMISGPKANEFVSRFALSKSYEIPSWRPLLIAQQAYAQAAIMILSQPEDFESVMLWTPSSLYALVELCHTSASKHSELSRAAVVESLSMIMHFCYMLNYVEFAFNLKLISLLSGLQSDNVDPNYFRQICYMTNFLPGASVLNLHSVILDTVESKMLRFDLRCTLMNAFIRVISRIPLTLSQLFDLLVRFQNEFTKLIDLFISENICAHISSLGSPQTLFFLELIHLYVEFFLVASKSTGINSIHWRQKILESSIIQSIMAALTNSDFIENVSPSCVRDMCKILDLMKVDRQAQIRYFNNSDFKYTLKTAQVFVLNRISYSKLYWEALWLLLSTRWLQNVPVTDFTPKFEISNQEVDFDVDTFSKMLNFCMSKQSSACDDINVDIPHQPITTYFDHESLLNIIIWGQAVNQRFEDLARSAFMSIIELESQCHGIFEIEFLLRWLSSIKVKEGYIDRLFRICLFSTSKALEDLMTKLYCSDSILEYAMREAKISLIADEDPGLFIKILKNYKDSKIFEKLITVTDHSSLKLLILQGFSSNKPENIALLNDLVQSLSISISYLVASYIVQNFSNLSRSQREVLFRPFLLLWAQDSTDLENNLDETLPAFIKHVENCLTFDLIQTSPFIDATLWSVLEHFYKKAPRDSKFFLRLSEASFRLKESILGNLGFEIDEICFNSQFGWDYSFGKFLENEIASNDALAHPMYKFPESVLAAFPRAAAENFHVQFSIRFFEIVIDRIIKVTDNSRYHWMDLLKVYCYYSDVSVSNLEPMKRGIAEYLRLVYSKILNREWVHPTTFICWRDLWLKEFRAANLKLLRDTARNKKIEEDVFAMEPLETPINFLDVTRIAIDILPISDNSMGGIGSVMWFNSMLIYRNVKYADAFVESGLLLVFIHRLSTSVHLSPFEAYSAVTHLSTAFARSQRLRAQCIYENINGDCKLEPSENYFYEYTVDYDSVSLILEAVKESFAFMKGVLYPRGTLKNVSIALGASSTKKSSCPSFDSKQFNDVSESCLVYVVDTFSAIILDTTDSNEVQKQSDCVKALISLRCLVDIVKISSDARSLIKLPLIVRCFSLGSRYHSDDPRMEYTSAIPELSQHAFLLIENLTEKSHYDSVTIKVRKNLEDQMEKVLLAMSITLESTVPKLASKSLEQSAFCFYHCLLSFYYLLENDECGQWDLWAMVNSEDGCYKPFFLITRFRIMELIGRCSLLFDMNAHFMYDIRRWIITVFNKFRKLQNLKLVPHVPLMKECIDSGKFTELQSIWSDTDGSTVSICSDKCSSNSEYNKLLDQEAGEYDLLDSDENLKQVDSFPGEIKNMPMEVKDFVAELNDKGDSRKTFSRNQPIMHALKSEGSVLDTDELRVPNSGQQFEFILDTGPEIYHGEEELSKILYEVELEWENRGFLFKHSDTSLTYDFHYMQTALTSANNNLRNPPVTYSVNYSLADSSNFKQSQKFDDELNNTAGIYAQTTPVNFDHVDVMNKIPYDLGPLDFSLRNVSPYKVRTDIPDKHFSAKMGTFLCLLAFTHLESYKMPLEQHGYKKMFFNYHNAEQILKIIIDLVSDSSAEHINAIFNSLKNLYLGTDKMHFLDTAFSQINMEFSMVPGLFVTASLVISNLLTFLMSTIISRYDNEPYNEQLRTTMGLVLLKYSSELVTLLYTPLILNNKLLLRKVCELLDDLIPLNPSNFKPRLDIQSISRLINLLCSKECESFVFDFITKMIVNYVNEPAIFITIVRETCRAQTALITLLQGPTDLRDLMTQIKKSDHIATEQFKILRLLRLIDKLFRGHESLDMLQKVNLIPLWQSLSIQMSDMQKYPVKSILSALSTLEIIAIPALTMEREFLICKEELVVKPKFSMYKNFYQNTISFIREKLLKFRSLFRELLRFKPNLLSDAVKELANSYALWTFKCKNLILDPSLTDMNSKRSWRGKICLNIDQTQVLQSSVEKIISLKPHEMKRKLQINLIDEPSQHLGISPEWLELVCEEISTKICGFFSPTSVNSPKAEDESVNFFKFVGRILGRLVFDRTTVSLKLSQTIYAFLTGSEVCFEELKQVDENYYQKLLKIMTTEIFDNLDQTFSVEINHIGQASVIDLVPEGRTIRVTEENKSEYVKAVVDFKLIKCFEKQLTAIASGFNDVVKLKLIRHFSALELELLITGVSDIDVDLWKQNSLYEGYSSSSQQIEWFWEVVRSFDEEQRVRLLNFCTGLCRIPNHGFTKEKDQEESCQFKFTIAREGSTGKHPYAQISMKRIFLPQYDSYIELRLFLLKAISGDFNEFY